MICELYNKMLDIESRIIAYGDDDYGISTHHYNTVTLHDFLLELFIFCALIFLIPLWWIPLYVISKPLKKIVFECKRKY